MTRSTEVKSHIYQHPPVELTSDPGYELQKRGTEHDAHDMARMGKVQSLRVKLCPTKSKLLLKNLQRNFGSYSILGFSMILMATWENLNATTTFGLTNGGTAGAIYIYIFTFFGFGLSVVSMAEMSSMAPTAGGQYHWVSEFAPPGAQKILSYMSGWLCVLGWQSAVAAGCFLAGTEIQGLIVLNHSDYDPQRWHGTLIAMALIFFSLFINSILARNLPHIEGLILILHIFGFVAIVTPLWVLGDLSRSREVFTSFNDGGNWHSTFLATLIGILSPQVTLIGPDAAVHMAEEVRNASRTIPRIMLATMVFNGALGFVMLVTLCFCVGNLQDVLDTKTGYPFIQIFYNATSQGATTMVSILIVCNEFAGVTAMATASRQLFSFARDQGVPFHTFFEQVRPGWDIPLNAVLTTTVFSILLVSISFGSTVAFNQLTALSTIALLASYILSIGSMTLLRIQGRPLLKCQFSLGRYGFLINILSLLFLMLSFLMVCFPPARDPSLQNMNWSIVIFAGVLMLSGIYYFFRARHKYVGPVKLVRKMD